MALVGCSSALACGRIGYDTFSSAAVQGDDAGAGSPPGGGSGAATTAGGTDGGTLTGGGGGASSSGGAGGASPVLDSGGTAQLDGATLRDAATDAGSPDGGGRPRCGNGVIDVGEACDDKGASATCNASCSLSSCGDGEVDGPAGEACDTGDHLTTCGITCQPMTCRAGCTCEWYMGHRYMLCPDLLESTPAQQACNAFGMRVVRVDSGQESSWLRLRSKQSAYPKFHIGASDTLVEGAWRWEDGTQFWTGTGSGATVGGHFAFWAAGEPNNQNGNENCGEIQSIQGWNDSRCDFEAKPTVCKQSRDPRPTCGDGLVQAGETCDATKATAACDADCSPVVCGDGTVNAAAGEVCDDGGQLQYCSADCKAVVCPPSCSCFASNGSNYALCAALSAFGDAAVDCGRHGMALARVESLAENQAIRATATSSGVGQFWLGAVDVDAEGQWIWLDTSPLWTGAAAGTAHGYAHFTAGAPGGGNTKNCLQVLANGEWTDADCATTAAYVCERVLP